MKALTAIWDNLKGLYSLLVGLSITGRYGLGPFPIWLKLQKPENGYPQLTVHYPRETVADEALVSYRGPVELVPGEPDPAQNKCISCQMCARSCPGACLTVVKGDEGKAPKTWISDFSLCCLCGTCVEVCPTKALRFSHDIYLVTETREELQMDLLAKLAKKAKKTEAA